MATVVLKRQRKKRLEAGHPWIYQSEVEEIRGEASPGDMVDIVNHQGHFLARGYINPRSQIIVRVVSYGHDDLDDELITSRLQQALAWRERFLPGATSYRLVYGEADFLPGLVVDRFEDVLVMQILTLGMEVRRQLIIDALTKIMQPRAIYERNDVPVRELEGLKLYQGWTYGEGPENVTIEENGLKFRVNIVEGQKTGYFFDQRENRAALRPMVPGARVLDCFCHTGSFALHAAYYGAREVLGIDISEVAIEQARSNAELNSLTSVQFRVGNAFDELRSFYDQGERFDLIILDPPAFTKSRHNIEGAYRGYKEINLRAMKILNPGGFLVTNSCSYHMSAELFHTMLLDARTDVHRPVRLVEWRTQGKDHPILLGSDETQYLKYVILQVL